MVAFGKVVAWVNVASLAGLIVMGVMDYAGEDVHGRRLNGAAFLSPKVVSDAMEAGAAPITAPTTYHSHTTYHTSGEDPMAEMQARQQISFLVQLCWAGLQLLYGIYHYTSCIKPTAQMYVRSTTVVPDDLKGDFKFGLFDCFSDLKTCCGFVCCPTCFMADLWYRMGHIQEKQNMHGEDASKAFLYGAGGAICLQCLNLNAVVGCCNVLMRGGFNGQDCGGTTSFRTRFNIPNEGFGTFISDCLTWCCCTPCAGTQEYRQVMALLERSPSQVQMQPQV